MAAPGVASALVVEVGGSPLPARLMNTLVEGYVDDSRTLPDLFLLRFRDPDRTLLAQGGIEVGAEIALLARSGGGTEPRPLLDGVVTALELELDESGTYTVVRGLDETYKLLRGARVAGYQNMTLSDIVAQVARRAGLKPGTVDVAGPVLDHVAQANVSDWEFVRGLAEEAGAQAYVRDGALHVVKPAEAGGAPDASARADRDPLVLERGANLLRCRASVSAAEQVSEVEVRGWDVRGKRALVGRAPAGASATLALGVTAAQVTAPFGEARHVVTDGGYGTQERVDRAAKALAERIAGSFAELEAVIRGNPEVRAGTAVALNAVGAPFEGRYTVTSSRHVFDALRGYETWLTVSGQQERSLYGLTGGGPAADRRPGGLVNATVTDTQDPEGSGRVKVAFPWLSDEYASDWARTAQAAGTGGGEPYIPEVGDEVVVGFELGRLDRPYVLGGLYNGQDRPSGGGAVDPTSGAVDRRAFASKGGHRLELLDAAGGAQGVRLRTGDGKLTIDLDQAGTAVTVGSDGAVRITAKEKVSITASGGVSVDAERGALELSGDSVSVTARQGVRVDGGQGEVRLATGGTVDVRGATVTVDGTQRTELRGGTTLSVEAPLVKIN
ncbi:VgrG-related protein [Streptomyces filamentosus]|uniref:Type IV secretion protein Rhs n=1 Tax=Streptomyces filamentosus TaxID=67294 RepID=A0A919ERI7_STRFL|nr:VgrG-related protein [Streptomyces filamentosus]GHG25261.1 type IV secretion protein Rhs [Streptomyces filamentosus]